MANDVTNAILDTIQSKLSGVAVDQIKLELFNTCDEVAREALRVSAPTNVSAEPDTWLPSTAWVPNYQVLLDGTLARLYGQIGKPYASPEFAKYHLDRYMVLLQLSRSDAAASPTTIYERILFDLRKRIPVARDSDLTAVLFTVANKIRLDALRLAALTDSDTTPSSWLPSGTWATAYQAMFKGALAELYLQADRPWAQPELGAATQTQFMQELELLRSDAADLPATVHQRILFDLRKRIPVARDSDLTAVLFTVANKIRLDALRLVALTDNDTTPSNWLPSGTWPTAYQAMFKGALAELYLQADRPWAQPELGAATQTQFMQELELLRSDAADLPATVYQRILFDLRKRIPVARDSDLTAVLFTVANKIRLDALRLAALTDNDTTPSGWLPSGTWPTAYQAMFKGALAELYLQADRPWAQLELGAATQAQFMQELELLRSDASTTATTHYERLINSIRAQIPTIRDSAISLEAFNTADKIRREALRIDPLSATAGPTDWFPTDKWDNCYQAMLHGTLARLFAQTDRPWSNPALAQAEYALYQQELDLVRGEQAKEKSTTLITRLLDNLVVALPGARDNIIKLELYNVLNDFFQDTNIWFEDLDFDVVSGEQIYDVFATPPSAIVRLLGVVNGNQLPVTAYMDTPGTIMLRDVPSQVSTFTARVSLTVSDPTRSSGVPVCPDWVVNKYQNDIIDGVLGRMMAQIAKPYSNPQLAVFHSRSFRTAIANARQEAARRNVFRAQAWGFPQGWSRRKTFR